MNGKTRRNVGAICACVVFAAGCASPDPKQDIHDADDDILFGSEVLSSPFADTPFHEDGIYIDTFHGTVSLIGLVDIGWPHTTAFDLDTDVDSVDHVHTHPLHIDGACQLFSEPEAHR